MGIVYGPFTNEDWYTMLALREDLKFMYTLDRKKFDIAIRWTKERLKLEIQQRQNAA